MGCQRARGVSILLAGIIWALPVAGQGADEGTRAAARKLGNAGVEAFQSGNWQLAAEKLDKAYQVLRAPSLGLWSARALVKVGKLLQASERYLEVTRLQPTAGDVSVQKQAQADAAAELEALQQRIPSVVVRLDGAEANEVSVTLDGTALSAALIGEARPVDPGRHRVEGRRGDDAVQAEVLVKEGEQGTAVLRFASASASEAPSVAAASSGVSSEVGKDRDPTAGSSPLRTIGWVALGVGGVGLGVGAVTGVMALGKRSEVNENPNCEGNRCAASEQELADSLNSLRTFSTIGFVAGGVLAAAGVTLVLTSGTSSEPSAAAWLGPNGGGLRGRF